MSTLPGRSFTLLALALIFCAFFAKLSWRSLPLHAEPAAPASWSWQAMPDLDVARYNHTATLLNDGRVLILGGYGQGNERLDSAEIFDPATGAWRTLTATSAAPRVFHTATRLNDGRVLVIGGGLAFDATPNGGGSVKTPGSQARGLSTRSVEPSVPPGAVTQTVTLHLSDVVASALITTTAQSPDYRPTAYGFLWDVSVNGEQQTAFDLLQPATVTLSGISEDLPDAALLYWDSAASAWVAPSQDCIPTQHASRFTSYVSRPSLPNSAAAAATASSHRE
jgi:hypothetical protein